MRISSTKCYAHPQPQLSYGPSHEAPNSQPSLASLPTLSYTTSSHQRLLIRATCNGTARVSNPRAHNNQQSCKPVLMSINSSPPKNYARHTTCFALQPWTTCTPGRCIPMAQVPSLCDHSATCNTCLWPTLQPQCYTCPCHTIQNRWRDNSCFQRHPRYTQHPWI